MTDLAPPPHRSYSQYETYTSCGEKYRLKYQAGVPEEPSVWTVGGHAFHEVTETFDRAVFDYACEPAALAVTRPHWEVVMARLVAEQEAKYPDVPVEKWRTAGRVTKDKPDKENLAWWLDAGWKMVQDYVAWRIAHEADYTILELPNGDPAIEVTMTVLFGDVPVKMAPDLCLVDSNGSPLMVDKKTGSRRVTKFHQLGFYSAGMSELFDMSFDYGAYYMARSATLTEPRLINQFTPQRIGAMVQTLDKNIRDRVFLPVVDDHCSYCAVRDHCRFQPAATPYPGDEDIWT